MNSNGFLLFQVFGPVLTDAWKLKDHVKEFNVSFRVIESDLGSEQHITIVSKKKRKGRRRRRRASTKTTSLQKTNFYGMPSTEVFNNENKVYSASCDLCKNATRSVDSTETGMEVTFTNLVSTFGADWEMVATVLGPTRPNGRHFCPFCEIMLSNMTKGVLQAPFLSRNTQMRDKTSLSYLKTVP